MCPTATPHFKSLSHTVEDLQILHCEKNRIIHGDMLQKQYFLNMKNERKNIMIRPFCRAWNDLSNDISFVFFYSFFSRPFALNLKLQTLMHFCVDSRDGIGWPFNRTEPTDRNRNRFGWRLFKNSVGYGRLGWKFLKIRSVTVG